MARSTLKVFTIGYEKRTVSEFVEALQRARVARVIDVRELPLSRRRGFSKTSLREALNEAGIEYVHLREAGNPHRGLKHDIKACLSAYRSHLRASPEVVARLIETIGDRPSVLLCVERDPACCHRSILAETMGRATPVAIVDL